MVIVLILQDLQPVYYSEALHKLKLVSLDKETIAWVELRINGRLLLNWVSIAIIPVYIMTIDEDL